MASWLESRCTIRVYDPCFFHRWQKKLEKAILELMGAGGLGRRTLLQLTIACWHLMKCYPLDQFKRMWKSLIDGKKKGEWADERGVFVDAFEQLDTVIEEGKEDELLGFQSIDRAVLTRWRYVNRAVRHLHDNWLGWHAIDRAVRNMTSGGQGRKSKEDGACGRRRR